MASLSSVISEDELYYWESLLQDWGLVIAVVLLMAELLIMATRKRLTMHILGDTLVNFVTLGLFYVIGFVLVGAAYVAGLYWLFFNASVTQLPINGWTLLFAIVLADIVYYWEHRFMHRCNLGWATHTVHHSSPYFNLSVAYRFGPFDGILPFIFHMPLAALGFNPILIIAAEGLVQLYQTFLHTEVIKKLPKPIEWLFNTPSHHRVHHGSNSEYIDKNYGGIFILWDRLFGTFAEEKAPVKYGLTHPVNTLNPISVFAIGITRLAKQLGNITGWENKCKHLLSPPTEFNKNSN